MFKPCSRNEKEITEESPLKPAAVFHRKREKSEKKEADTRSWKSKYRIERRRGRKDEDFLITPLVSNSLLTLS